MAEAGGSSGSNGRPDEDGAGVRERRGKEEKEKKRERKERKTEEDG